MVQPKSQDLYILQNEHGLIKIGRSIDVTDRIAKIRYAERCDTYLVAQYAYAGDIEESVHIGLSNYRLIGEWFCGSEEARIAIEEELGIEKIEWLVNYNPATAAEWVTHMREVRNVRRLKKAIYREYLILRSADEPHSVYDMSIFVLLRHPLIDAVGELEMHMVAGKLTRFHHDRASGKLKPIPCYTSDVQSALNTWPDKTRPKEWRGSAIECCIVGLSSLNSRIRELPRQV